MIWLSASSNSPTISVAKWTLAGANVTLTLEHVVDAAPVAPSRDDGNPAAPGAGAYRVLSKTEGTTGPDGE